MEFHIGGLVRLEQYTASYHVVDVFVNVILHLSSLNT